MHDTRWWEDIVDKASSDIQVYIRVVGVLQQDLENHGVFTRNPAKPTKSLFNTLLRLFCFDQ